VTDPRATLSRRELALRSARVTAAAALPSFVAGGLTLPGSAAAQTAQDPADTLLIPAIGIEDTLVSVYGKAAGSGRLNPSERRLVALLGEQSKEHARILRDELSDEAEFPPAGGEVPGLGAKTPARGYFETALTFENQVYIAYLDTIGGLEPGETSLIVSGLAAGTAQHLALLRQALGRDPILGPAETGASV
jgi:hypothetical protein